MDFLQLWFSLKKFGRPRHFYLGFVYSILIDLTVNVFPSPYSSFQIDLYYCFGTTLLNVTRNKIALLRKQSLEVLKVHFNINEITIRVFKSKKVRYDGFFISSVHYFTVIVRVFKNLFQTRGGKF